MKTLLYLTTMTLFSFLLAIGLYGFMEPEYVRVSIELPEKAPAKKVEYTGICKTSGTIKCREWRKRNES